MKGHCHWQERVYIELIVDGEIVDLNRIELPRDTVIPNTVIVDERFKDGEAKR